MDYKEIHMGNDRCEEMEYYDFRYNNYERVQICELEKPVRLVQDWSVGKGGTVWDASFVLAKYLETLDLESKSVIELGTGTGLAAICSCYKGANVTATDLSPVLSLTQRNIDLNSEFLKGSISCKELDWTNREQYEEFTRIHWDYIIMSDVFYLPSIAGNFSELLKELIKADTKVIICYKFRVLHTVEPYLSALSEYEQISLDSWIPSVHPNKNLHLIQLTL